MKYHEILKIFRQNENYCKLSICEINLLKIMLEFANYNPNYDSLPLYSIRFSYTIHISDDVDREIRLISKNTYYKSITNLIKFGFISNLKRGYSLSDSNKSSSIFQLNVNMNSSAIDKPDSKIIPKTPKAIESTELTPKAIELTPELTPKAIEVTTEVTPNAIEVTPELTTEDDNNKNIYNSTNNILDFKREESMHPLLRDFEPKPTNYITDFDRELPGFETASEALEWLSKCQFDHRNEILKKDYDRIKKYYESELLDEQKSIQYV